MHVPQKNAPLIAGPRGAAVRLGLKRTTLNFTLKKVRIDQYDEKTAMNEQSLKGPNLLVLDSDYQKTRIEELRSHRKLLWERFENSPDDTRLALELKLIDDQIAKCNQQIKADNKGRKG
jgi:hypothetical protein